MEHQLPTPLSPLSQAVAPARLGLQFTETMKGYFSPKVKDDFAQGAKQGKEADSPCEFTFTIISDDLEDMIDTKLRSIDN